MDGNGVLKIHRTKLANDVGRIPPIWSMYLVVSLIVKPAKTKRWDQDI